MAHPGTEAVETPAPVSVEEKAADFADFLGDDYLDEEAPHDGAEPEEEGVEGEEADDDFELEDDEEGEEPDTYQEPARPPATGFFRHQSTRQ